MKLRAAVSALAVTALLVTAAAPAVAADKAKAKGASQFYLDYLSAFAKAKSIDEITPFLAKEKVAQIEKTPKEDRAKMFGMIKMMTPTDIKVVKETKTDKGWSLDVTGKGGMSEGATKGTVTILLEDGKMKIDQENWKS